MKDKNKTLRIYLYKTEVELGHVDINISPSATGREIINATYEYMHNIAMPGLAIEDLKRDWLITHVEQIYAQQSQLVA